MVAAPFLVATPANMTTIALEQTQTTLAELIHPPPWPATTAACSSYEERSTPCSTTGNRPGWSFTSPSSGSRPTAPCTPHDLRRTCASWLVQAGTPIQEVARLLRHADIQTTLDIYAHLMPDQLRGTVAILERHNLVIGPEQIEEKAAVSR